MRPNPMTASPTHWSLGRWRTVAAANGPLSVHGCQSPWTRNSARAMMRTAALMCPVTKLMASMDGSLLPVGDDGVDGEEHEDEDDEDDGKNVHGRDRKSTRLNSSHVKISYAVFCLKKKR